MIVGSRSSSTTSSCHGEAVGAWVTNAAAVHGGVRRVGCRRDAAASATMKETRQQRRARERAEGKTTTRPGPNPPPQPPPSAATDAIGTIAADDVVEVTLTRMVEIAPVEGFTE